MIDQEALTSIPNSLEIGGKYYPVIVTGRKPACWKCGVIGYLTPFCPVKASGVPPKPDTPRADTTSSTAPVICLYAADTGGEKAPVGSLPDLTFPAKKKVEQKQEWQAVGRARGKLHAAGSHSSEAPRASTLIVPFPRVRLLLTCPKAARAFYEI